MVRPQGLLHDRQCPLVERLGLGESMQGLSLEQARTLEERSSKIDGEILKIEARIAEAPAEGLVGVAVKLRLADFYRD